MKAKLVKFDDDGTQCKRDIEYLRRHPECGIPFIQDKPFKPDNPKHKFRPYDRNFNIDILDRAIPSDPNIPPAQPIGKPPKIGEAVGGPPYANVYLPQDYTNRYDLAGRRILEDTPHGNSVDEYLSAKIVNYFNKSGYGVLPIIGNDTYSHETPERPTGPVGEVELEDFGAGVGIPNEAPPPISQTRTRPLADPRDTEFTEQVRPRGMTDEELIDLQMQQLTRNSTQEEAKMIESQIKAQTRRTTLPKRRVPVPEIEGTEIVAIEPENEEQLIVREAERFTRAGRPTISQREAEQIANKFLEKGISRSRTLQILEEFNLYDSQGEFELQAIADPNERAMIRRMRAQRIIEAERRDTNLLPERLQEIELREDTPLTRGRTDIAPGRTRIQKVMDKTAGKLPEELRSVYKSTQRNAEAFNENVRTRSLEAIQRVRSTTTRVFGQRYSNIRETALELRGGDIELVAPEGNINIRPPATEEITGLRPGDLQALDFNPLGADYQETFVGETRPTLNYAERLQQTRFEGNPLAYNEVTTFATQTGVAGAGAVGGVLIGFGVAQLMQSKGVDNKYAIAATAGGAGGAGARILTMAGSRALTRGGATAIVDTASTIAIKAGTSLTYVGQQKVLL
jgi:hypothetical protein